MSFDVGNLDLPHPNAVDSLHFPYMDGWKPTILVFYCI